MKTMRREMALPKACGRQVPIFNSVKTRTNRNTDNKYVVAGTNASTDTNTITNTDTNAHTGIKFLVADTEYLVAGININTDTNTKTSIDY